MKILLSVNWVLMASIWYFINGILHDIFVLIKHKWIYNRELMNLMVDGHLLILSGVILFVCYLMLLNKIQCGALIAIIVAVGMLIFCLLAFPFLKSYGTIAFSIMVIIVCIRAYPTFPNIYEIMQKYK
jgi:hypothetical protein